MAARRESEMIPEPPARVTTIRDAETLALFCQAMRANDWIAVDTEFLREKTYYPKLCLVQIADTEQAGVIDVLAIDDLDPLVALLGDAGVTKVFHSAEQDLEVLLQTCRVMPAPLFDTQLAGPLVGLDDQMGYARMIETLTGVVLSKAHTRTDWSRRPLPDGAIGYAADDVRYLVVAYSVIVDRLVHLERRAWAEADAARLTDTQRFEPAIDTAWRRVKGVSRLSPATQPIVAELAAWREQVAIESDRPRRWILADADLIQLAEQAPDSDIALADAVGLSDKMLTRHGEALLAAVTRGRAAGPVVLDPNAGPPDAATRRAVKHAAQRLEQAAGAADLPASVLASRSELARLVAGERDLRLLSDWRFHVAGRLVLEAVEAHQAGEPD